MEATTWLEIGGVLVTNPMNVLTNVILTVQCAAYAVLLRRRRTTGTAEWSAFLLLMSVATGAGAVKHGFGYVLERQVYEVVLAISNATGGLSTYCAQIATIRRWSPRRTAVLGAVAYAQVVAFLAVNLVLGPELLLLIVNTAVGLVPVIAVEGRSTRGVRPGSRMIAVGLSVAILAGLVYGADISLGPWFDHIDLAHAVMALSFHAIAWGAAPRALRSAPGHESWAS